MHAVFAARCLAATKVANGFVVTEHKRSVRIEIRIDVLESFPNVFMYG